MIALSSIFYDNLADIVLIYTKYKYKFNNSIYNFSNILLTKMIVQVFRNMSMYSYHKRNNFYHFVNEKPQYH